jgi:hypothetical protein
MQKVGDAWNPENGLGDGYIDFNNMRKQHIEAFECLCPNVGMLQCSVAALALSHSITIQESFHAACNRMHAVVVRALFPSLIKVFPNGQYPFREDGLEAAT